ncbi:MAG: hypothetical protein VX095_07600 [Pseudomonadota bacterium]|nr:hypothetical protein [Pseudomonadota bacterium]
MSDVDRRLTSQLILLRETTDVVERSRKAWLGDSLSGASLLKLNYAASDIGCLLATLDDPEAIKQRKRWMKLQQKLSQGIAWLRSIDLLRDSLSESDLNKIASAVARLSSKPVSQCHKLMSRPEWVRTRRRWYRYLDASPHHDHAEVITVAMTERTEHHFLKLQKRIVKHDNDKDWLKLVVVIGQLKVILSLLAASNRDYQVRLDLVCDIESHLRLWCLTHSRLPLLKLLSATPEVDDRAGLADRIANIRLQEQLSAHRRKERVRKLLIKPSDD